VWESMPVLKAELDLFEQLLYQQFTSRRNINSYLDKLSLNIIKSGGKRLRPAMTVSSGMLGKYDREKVLQAALSVELLHTATLVHDDIIDEAPIRRNAPTVYAREGTNTAVFTGDYLFIKSILALAGTGLPVSYQEQLARAVEAVCVGEVEQFRCRGSLPGFKTYLSRITRKTGFLFAACCAAGAYLGGLPDESIKLAVRFGNCYGTAFQIRDDLLDILGDQRRIGKPVGNDLTEGIFTLPVLLAAAKDRALAELIINLGNDEKYGENIRTIIKSVLESGSIGEAETILGRYIERAEKYLERLPVTEGKEMLGFILHATFRETAANAGCVS
jgi:heptaprenyl diphosphate synthase